MNTKNGLIFDGNNLSSPYIDNAGFHNSIYREKNISSYLTDGSLWTRISSGKFNDLFVGDYFNIVLDGALSVMRIAGFDTFLKTGVTEISTHHVVIISDVIFENAPMISAETTGGYLNTTMYKTTLPKWAAYLEIEIGASHVLQTTEFLTSSIDVNAKNVMRQDLIGASNGCNWGTQHANLLSETEVYGYMSYSSSGYENGMSNYGQLPLFRLNPSKIIALTLNGNRTDYWLRNVASSYKFCSVEKHGIASYLDNDSIGVGVRPRFVIG